MKKKRKLALRKITIASIKNSNRVRGGTNNPTTADPFPSAACDTLIECTNGCDTQEECTNTCACDTQLQCTNGCTDTTATAGTTNTVTDVNCNVLTQ